MNLYDCICYRASFINGKFWVLTPGVSASRCDDHSNRR